MLIALQKRETQSRSSWLQTAIPKIKPSSDPTNRHVQAKMFPLFIADLSLVRHAAFRPLMVSLVILGIMTFGAVGTLRGQEGFTRGSSRSVIYEPDGKRRINELEFVLACDRDCCLAGQVYKRLEEPNFKPIELFVLANTGNKFAIQISVDRREGQVLTTEGKWSVEHLVELTNIKFDDSFESRFQVAMVNASSSIALPVYLSWHSVGVTKDTMLSALRGTNYRGDNELGALEILGTRGIGRIVLKKSRSNLHSPGWLPLSKISNSVFPKALESIEEEYSFSPERRYGEHDPYRCAGTITQTDPEGRSRKTEVEIQVTEQADARTARKFIDAILAKMPNTQKIISNSEIASVLDHGKQKVVVDRDVERITETRFTNKSPSLYYYGIILLFLVILGLIGYLRWAQ